MNLRNRRVQLLALLSVPSGMPLGLLLNTLQIFLRSAGVDLKTIGLLSSVSLPYSFKFLWSPFIDRYALPWPGRRRGWILFSQLLMAFLTGALAAWVLRALTVDSAGQLHLTAAATTLIGVLAFAIACVSANQDIALDAYAVEIIEPNEAGPASGLRIMYYRLGMLLAGAFAIFAAGFIGWPLVFAACAALFVLFGAVTLAAPEPVRPAAAPRSLSSAVVEPFVAFFKRPQALSIAAFLILYKFGDNLGGTMVNPFLKDLCFQNKEIGLVVKVIGTAATIGGSALGAFIMSRLGLGRALWIFGGLQGIGAGLYGFAALAHQGPIAIQACVANPHITDQVRAYTYVAIAGEYLFTGMGTAALVALVLRLCERRYGATQYALLSSLFGLGRSLSGIPSGFLAERLGYPVFFGVSLLAAIPGLAMLQVIAPWGSRDVAALANVPDEPDGPPVDSRLH